MSVKGCVCLVILLCPKVKYVIGTKYLLIVSMKIVCACCSHITLFLAMCWNHIAMYLVFTISKLQFPPL